MGNNEQYREAYDMLCEWEMGYVMLKNWNFSLPVTLTPEELSEWLLNTKGIKVSYKDNIYLQDLQKAIDDQKAPLHNPVKNISRSKYERCTKLAVDTDIYYSEHSGAVWMHKYNCDKYYYWEDYNTKNEVIYFRGEVDWVKSNYEPYEDQDTTTCDDIVMSMENSKSPKNDDFVSPLKDAYKPWLNTVTDNDYWERIKSSEGVHASLGYVVETDELITPITEWTDKHYDFNYTLTEDDIEKGVIKIDPYFVADQWKLGEKDNSGVIFHILKTCSRYKCKHKEEREIKAIYGQIKRLAELRGIEL